MTPKDLQLLIELGLVEAIAVTPDMRTTVFRISHAGIVLAQNEGVRPKRLNASNPLPSRRAGRVVRMKP